MARVGRTSVESCSELAHICLRPPSEGIGLLPTILRRPCQLDFVQQIEMRGFASLLAFASAASAAVVWDGRFNNFT